MNTMGMMVKAAIATLFLAAVSLVTLGWNVYARFDGMKKDIKFEVRTEMIEIRNRDVKWMQGRFNTLEKITVGKVVTPDENLDIVITK